MPTLEEVEDMLEAKRVLREKIEAAHRHSLEKKMDAERYKRAAAAAFSLFNKAHKREKDARVGRAAT